MTENTTEIKRFVAPSMTRALELVREEMGPEAVILSSQKVKGGVEIITSVERDLQTRGVSERRAFGQNFDAEYDQPLDSDTSWQSQAGIAQAAAGYPGQVELNGVDALNKGKSGSDIAQEIERAREKMVAAKRDAAERTESSSQGTRGARVERQSNQEKHEKLKQKIDDDEKLESLRDELADLRMLLEQQLWQKQGFGDFAQTTLNTVQPSADVPEANAASKNLLKQHLSRLGLTDALCQELVASSEMKHGLNKAWKFSLASLARRIPLAQSVDVQAGGVFAFVGPTGVGKTTTIAKLAAQFSMKHGAGKVALVSMDTHRVGAAEQLRALGRILDAPVRMIDGENCLMTTLIGLRQFPLILIDTAGFRHGDPKLKAQLAQLDENPAVKRLLVLSALSQYQTLKASIHAYQNKQHVDGCVLTKLDEASGLGEALSAVISHNVALSYTTNGQQIPSDIHLASGHSLVASAVALSRKTTATEGVLS